MSKIFGEVTQNGYVVGNLDTAIKHWTETLGVGPFFVYRNLKFKSYSYMGIQSDPVLDLAISSSGGLQIELIQQVNDAHSFFKHFMDESGPGLQHLSVWTQEYDALTSRAAERGLAPISSGVALSGDRFSFYGSPPGNGDVMEVLECPLPLLERMRGIRQATEEWDGIDPVRAYNSAAALA